MRFEQLRVLLLCSSERLRLLRLKKSSAAKTLGGVSWTNGLAPVRISFSKRKRQKSPVYKLSGGRPAPAWQTFNSGDS